MSADVELLSPHELSDSDIDHWKRVQRTNPDLASPFFHPEFTRAVADSRDDVFVGVIRKNGTPLALLPHQRSNGRMWTRGRPVGGLLSDYQGMICEQHTSFDARAFIRGCGLRFYDFNSIVAAQSPLRPFHVCRDVSWVMDLRDGFETYVRRQRSFHPSRMRDIDRLRRKVERDLGPLRYEWLGDAGSQHKANEIFRQAIDWKVANYRRVNTVNVFSFPWVVRSLGRICSIQTKEFAGTIAALYGGDRLLAIHIGMRTATVLHHWFAAYDIALRSYGPGILLLMEMARSVADMGLKTIDLSRGNEKYKQTLYNAGVPTARGWIEAQRSAMTYIGRWRRLLEAQMLQSPRLTSLVSYPARLLRASRLK